MFERVPSSGDLRRSGGKQIEKLLNSNISSVQRRSIVPGDYPSGMERGKVFTIMEKAHTLRAFSWLKAFSHLRHF